MLAIQRREYMQLQVQWDAARATWQAERAQLELAAEKCVYLGVCDFFFAKWFNTA